MEVVVAIVGGDVSQPGVAFRVSGANDRVQRESIELVFRRESRNESAQALRSRVAVAHCSPLGGFTTVGGFVTVGGLVVAAGFVVAPGLVVPGVLLARRF